ncbi:hypothetical protein RhiirC2_749657, partial [Rhizophagus irregularis]
MEFINAPIGHKNLANLATKSHHPKAYFTSRLLDFTSKKLNEILESENSQACHSNENTSKKLNKIPESEDSQSSVKANEML